MKRDSGSALLILLLMLVGLSAVVNAAFTVSTLDAKDVDCKKCHSDNPHRIHAAVAVSCEQCHGDKLNIAIPQCIKCHSGNIHQVHTKKVSTQSCSYCHKDITSVHNAFSQNTVCSHCHKDVIAVHGSDASCAKCHKSAPNIVKPVMSTGASIICQSCHEGTSVATVHGPPENMTVCYGCHKGTQKLEGSDVPHTIHAGKAKCEDCHLQEGKLVSPQCIRCHNVDNLHTFATVGKKTIVTLACSICHPEIKPTTPAATKTATPSTTATTPAGTATAAPTATKPAPGFECALAIAMLVMSSIAGRRLK